MPRWPPDGSRNRFRIQRLKDKLGNRSNASSEIEFDSRLRPGSSARRARGVRTIIEMVNHTRLDCVLGVGAGDAPGVVAGDCTTPHTARPSASA